MQRTRMGSGNNRRFVRLAAAAVACLVIGGATHIASASFNSGDLVVSRVGDGSAVLTGNATPVFLDEYLPATPAQAVTVSTLAMPNLAAAPTSGNRNLLLAGAANTEGILTLSGNGGYLVLAGYNSTTTTSGGPNSAVSTTINRVVGLVDANGNIDTTTALNDAMSAQNVRTAYTVDGSTVWVAGNGGNGVTINAVTGVPTNGVRAAQRGKSDPTNTSGTSVGLNQSGLTTNFRALNGAGGQLYVSSNGTSGTGAPNRGVDSVGVGSGFPTAPPQINTNIPTFPADASRSVGDYWFEDASTIYLADTRAFTGNTATSGGIQKYTLVAGNWTWQYTLGVGNNVSNSGAGNAGAVGLAGLFDGTNTFLYATTFDTNSGTGTGGVAQTNLVTITDTGAGSAVTVLATSPVNTAFRGVDFSPTTFVPEPTSIISLSGVAALAALRRRRNARD